MSRVQMEDRRGAQHVALEHRIGQLAGDHQRRRQVLGRGLDASFIGEQEARVAEHLPFAAPVAGSRAEASAASRFPGLRQPARRLREPGQDAPGARRRFGSQAGHRERGAGELDAEAERPVQLQHCPGALERRHRDGRIAADDRATARRHAVAELDRRHAGLGECGDVGPVRDLGGANGVGAAAAVGAQRPQALRRVLLDAADQLETLTRLAHERLVEQRLQHVDRPRFGVAVREPQHRLRRLHRESTLEDRQLRERLLLVRTTGPTTSRGSRAASPAVDPAAGRRAAKRSRIRSSSACGGIKRTRAAASSIASGRRSSSSSGSRVIALVARRVERSRWFAARARRTNSRWRRSTGAAPGPCLLTRDAESSRVVTRNVASGAASSQRPTVCRLPRHLLEVVEDHEAAAATRDRVAELRDRILFAERNVERRPTASRCRRCRAPRQIAEPGAARVQVPSQVQP